MVRLPRRSLPLMARDIMSTPPITVSEDTPLKEVSKLMCDRKIGSVIVLASDGTVRGIITERDVTCAIGQGYSVDSPAWEIMTPDPVTVGPDELITDVIEKMRDLGVRHMPVVDKDGKPLGVISSRDVMAIMELLMRLFRK